LEGDREWSVFTDLVLHGADGFVEGVDDEVAGSDADYFAEVGRVVVDSEGDGSGDVGGYGESCAGWVEAEREREGTSPSWADLVEGGEGAEDSGLIGIGMRGHSRESYRSNFPLTRNPDRFREEDFRINY
jgi:hypothetical protein